MRCKRWGGWKREDGKGEGSVGGEGAMLMRKKQKKKGKRTETSF